MRKHQKEQQNQQENQIGKLYQVKRVKSVDGIYHIVQSPSGNEVHRTPDVEEAMRVAEKMNYYFGK